MILLNLFTAVVLENFEIQEEQAEWTLTPGALEVCYHFGKGSHICKIETWLSLMDADSVEKAEIAQLMLY